MIIPACGVLRVGNRIVQKNVLGNKSIPRLNFLNYTRQRWVSDPFYFQTITYILRCLLRLWTWVSTYGYIYIESELNHLQCVNRYHFHFRPLANNTQLEIQVSHPCHPCSWWIWPSASIPIRPQQPWIEKFPHHYVCIPRAFLRKAVLPCTWSHMSLMTLQSNKVTMTLPIAQYNDSLHHIVGGWLSAMGYRCADIRATQRASSRRDWSHLRIVIKWIMITGLDAWIYIPRPNVAMRTYTFGHGIDKFPQQHMYRALSIRPG